MEINNQNMEPKKIIYYKQESISPEKEKQEIGNLLKGLQEKITIQ